MKETERKSFILEKLKILENRELKYEEWQFSVTKFYFTGFFSIVTAIFGLYNLGAISSTTSLWPYLAIVSFFSTAVLYSIANLDRERIQSKVNKDAFTRYYFDDDTAESSLELPSSTFLPLRTLISILTVLSYVMTLYFAFPQLRERVSLAYILVIVITSIIIAGILSGLIIVSLNSARKKAMDTQRRNDIRTLGTALAQYYTDHNETFPVLSGSIDDLWPFVSDYINHKPVDPKNSDGFVYSYKCKDGRSFKLIYKSEETGKLMTYDSSQIGF